jgi:hypothetical protein
MESAYGNIDTLEILQKSKTHSGMEEKNTAHIVPENKACSQMQLIVKHLTPFTKSHLRNAR